MRVDLAIVGAGIMGATIASQARRLIPGLSIAVIEAGNAEQSATRLSAGLVTPFCGEGTRRRRSEFAYRYYEEQASQHDDVRKVPFTFSHEQGRPQPLYCLRHACLRARWRQSSGDGVENWQQAACFKRGMLLSSMCPGWPLVI